MPVVPPRRSVTFKADRDTLLLMAAASALTLALSYSVRNRPAIPVAAIEQTATGQWAGELALLRPATIASPDPTEPLSSAALVVPKAAMALPVAAPSPAPSSSAPSSPAAVVKARGCDRAPCAPARIAAAAPAPVVPPRRLAPPAHATREASLAETLNPLNHIPDLVKRPFASAGDTIAGWVRRF